MGNSRSKSIPVPTPVPVVKIPTFNRNNQSVRITSSTSTSNTGTAPNIITPSLQPQNTSLKPGASWNNYGIGTASTTSATTTSSVFTSSIQSVPQVSVAVPQVSVEAICNVNLPVDGYRIKNVDSTTNSDFISPEIPYRTMVDKYIMRVCPQFNSRNGCNAGNYCYRFHVCQFWIKNSCAKPNCSGHILSDGHRNTALVNPLLHRRFNENDLFEMLKKGSFLGKAAKGEPGDLICLDDLAKNCKRKDCKFVHIGHPYVNCVWEINVNDDWLRFPVHINSEIEKTFCDPSADKLKISNKVNSKDLILSRILNDDDTTIDFDNMVLNSSCSFFRVRRLSTPSDMIYQKFQATRWLWFWEEELDSWKYYRHASISNGSNTFFILPLSDYLEFQFLKGTQTLKLVMANSSYTINFATMTQINDSTSIMRRIRRRPLIKLEKWNDNTTFKSLWDDSNISGKFFKRPIQKMTVEFSFVKQLLTETIPSISEIIIERIENPYLWKSYQIKKNSMLKSVGDEIELNEQYMFHGTKYKVVDKICSDNFDWRLFGTSVGSAYGQGTYFANSAAFSDSYSSRDESNYNCMFIALVLVGSSTVGNSKMTFPPINANTKMRFDTTVNSNRNPEIYVKYNMDEYYPAYFVKYK